MDGSPVTRPSLLLRVRDPRDAQAWTRFVDVYTPLVFNFCRRRGLQAADAADVAQDVMRAVSRSIGRFEYDPGRGAFRDWLYRVTRSKLTDFHRGRQREPAGSGESAVHDLLAEQADPDAEAAREADDWQQTWHRHRFDSAAERVRSEVQPATWKAFWATAVEGRPVQEVADELGLTPGAVYIARSRVLARLKSATGEMDE